MMLKTNFSILLILFFVSSLSADCPERDSLDHYYQTDDLEAFYAALDQLDRCDSDSSLRAYAYHQLARTLGYLGDNEQALFYARAASQIRELILEPHNAELAKSLYNLGLFSKLVHAYGDAENYLNRSADIFRKRDDPGPLMIVQKELADLAVIQGDFDKANELLQHNIQLAGEGIEKANFLLDLANLRLSQHRPEEAKKELEKAIILYLANKSDESFEPANLAACYLNLAYAYDEMADPLLALEYYQKAINNYRSIGQHYQEGKARANKSLTLIRLKRTNAAALELDRAERLARTGNYLDLLAQVSDNRGDLFMVRSEPLKALEAYQEAVSTLVSGWKPESPAECPPKELLLQTAYPEHLLNHLSDKAHCLQVCEGVVADSLRDSLALDHYYSLAALIDGMRYEQKVQASKLFWRESARPIYEAAVRLAERQGNLDAAWYFMERSKSMLLLDAIQENQARRQMEPTHARKERELRAELDQLRIRLSELPEAEKAVFMDSLLRKQREWESWKDSLSLMYPVFASTGWSPEPKSPEEIRGLLGSGNWLLIEYMLGDSALYVWSMAANGKTQFRSLPLGLFDEQLTAFMVQLQQAGKGIDPTAYAQKANFLYKSLLKPELQAFAEAEQLLIIPDGPIGLIPMDALMLINEWDPDSFLVHKYLVRYAYSAEVLIRQQAGALPEGRPLYMAPSLWPDDRGLSELDGSEEFAEEVSVRSMRELYGSNATADAFIRHSADSPLICLFTHASAGTDDVPRVELYDRSILLPEIYSMQIAADLVILAACETNIGDVQKGEGVMSLSRGFTYAGAASLVASLWKVGATSTQDIMTRFIDNMQSGQTKAEALWEAKKQYLENTNTNGTNPYNWAGFIYMGADNDLPLPRKRPWTLFLAGLGIVFIVAMLFRSRNGKSEGSSTSGM
ncbi:MAG: CHAT domain-containing protein [Bacteroidetes bacterium]|nr:CHAT domain-containing protein [Bacteroidota bacterium]